MSAPGQCFEAPESLPQPRARIPAARTQRSSPSSRLGVPGAARVRCRSTGAPVTRRRWPGPVCQRASAGIRLAGHDSPTPRLGSLTWPGLTTGEGRKRKAPTPNLGFVVTSHAIAGRPHSKTALEDAWPSASSFPFRARPQIPRRVERPECQLAVEQETKNRAWSQCPSLTEVDPVRSAPV